MKKEKIIKLFITLLTSVVIVFSILFYQNSIHENELEKFSYKKYLHEFGFSKTENPTEEEIQNSDKYFKLLDKATYEKNKENYTEAENIYMEAVKYNILGYQEIGRMYLEDIENTGKAIEYFEKAYDKGDINAAFWLGKSYEKLNDENMKRKWYEKGALNGDTDSEIYFGRLLYLENKKDEAEKWFRKVLINSKNAMAIYNLMIINYEKGNIKEVKKLQKQLHEKGVEEMDDDMLEKVKYMTGNKKQQHIFVYLNNADNFIEKKQYLEAEKEYIKAIKYDKKINYYLAELYRIYLKDIEKSAELHEEATRVGEKRAFAVLGDIYLNQGETKEATNWYKEGAKKGDSNSQYRIGRILQLSEEIKEAFKYYNKSAKQKNIYGIIRIIEYYYVNKNYREEKKWIYKVFNENNILELNKKRKFILLNRLREIEENN